MVTQKKIFFSPENNNWMKFLNLEILNREVEKSLVVSRVRWPPPPKKKIKMNTMIIMLAFLNSFHQTRVLPMTCAFMAVVIFFHSFYFFSGM